METLLNIFSADFLSQMTEGFYASMTEVPFGIRVLMVLLVVVIVMEARSLRRHRQMHSNMLKLQKTSDETSSSMSGASDAMTRLTTEVREEERKVKAMIKGDLNDQMRRHIERLASMQTSLAEAISEMAEKNVKNHQLTDDHRLKLEERLEGIVAVIKNRSSEGAPVSSETSPATGAMDPEQLKQLEEQIAKVPELVKEVLGEITSSDSTSSIAYTSVKDILGSIKTQLETALQAQGSVSETAGTVATAPAIGVGDGDERLNRVEDRLEKISELVKEVLRSGGSSEAVQLSDKIEQQAMYLHDEFAAISAKIDKLGGGAGGQPAASPSSAGDSSEVKPPSSLSSEDQTTVLKLLSDSMNRLSAEVDAKLTLLNSKLEKNLESRWSDAFSSFSSLREKLEDLAGAGEEMKNIKKDISSLSKLMIARTGMDEEGGGRQLAEMLQRMMSSEHFALDVDLPNGHCAAALLRFPDPRDSIAIDAGLSLQTFTESMDDSITSAERDTKRHAFRRELTSHIHHVADNLIMPPHTGESALIYIPSEAAFAEIHSRHRAAVDLALSRRIWLVSPTTLIAVVNTASSAFRDHNAHMRLIRLQETVSRIVQEAQNFDNRITEIGDHVNSAWRSVQRAENASGRLIGSIRDISLPDNDDQNKYNEPRKHVSNSVDASQDRS